MRFQRIRLKPQHGSVMRFGFVQSTSLLQQAGQVAMDWGIVRPQCQRLPISRFGLVELAQSPQYAGMAMTIRGIAGIRLDRIAEPYESEAIVAGPQRGEPKTMEYFGERICPFQLRSQTHCSLPPFRPGEPGPLCGIRN